MAPALLFPASPGCQVGRSVEGELKALQLGLADEGEWREEMGKDGNRRRLKLTHHRWRCLFLIFTGAKVGNLPGFVE